MLSSGEKPSLTALRPKANATGTYPMTIGKLSTTPLAKVVLTAGGLRLSAAWLCMVVGRRVDRTSIVYVQNITRE